MRFRHQLLVLSAVLLLPLVAPDAQATAAARQRDEVVAFMRTYVDVTNRADIHASMEMRSRNPNSSTAVLGAITRGWDALRAQADSAAGSEGSFKVALGSLDITPLGTAAALVVTAATITVATDQGPMQVRGALTVVLEKTGGTWKVLHDHISLPVE